jgi:hypothetical protein
VGTNRGLVKELVWFDRTDTEITDISLINVNIIFPFLLQKQLLLQLQIMPPWSHKNNISTSLPVDGRTKVLLAKRTTTVDSSSKCFH